MKHVVTWQYRVMRKRWQRGRKWGYSYGIYELYVLLSHMINGKNPGWTSDSMEPQGDTFAELRSDYECMAEAFKYPILDYKTGKPIFDKALPEKAIAEYEGKVEK